MLYCACRPLLHQDTPLHLLISSVKVALQRGFSNRQMKDLSKEIVSLVRTTGLCPKHNLAITVLVKLERFFPNVQYTLYKSGLGLCSHHLVHSAGLAVGHYGNLQRPSTTSTSKWKKKCMLSRNSVAHSWDVLLWTWCNR